MKYKSTCCHNFIMNEDDLKEIGTSSIYNQSSQTNENVWEIASEIFNLEEIYFEQVYFL